MQKQSKKLAGLGVLAAAYFVTGKIGLSFAYVHPSATGIWPPAGIALAGLLILGMDAWPAVLLGAFLVNVSTHGSMLACLGIATGNTMEALAGTWLITRYANGRNFVYRTPDVFKMALLAGLVSTTIGATFGVASLALGGYALKSGISAVWATWWLGDGTGNILVAPLLILWISQPRLRWRQSQFFEATALLLALSVTGLVIFDGVFNFAAKNYPLEYLCIPMLLWAAYRFGPREAAAATVVLAGTAIWGTLHGFGPFARPSHTASLLLLQTFVSVVAVTTMGLATAFAERRVAEEQTRRLAASDPLTGLGNYRKLLDALESEMRRSSRTGRSFVLLLMDMDGLKLINDAHGHLVGSRALCRLADVLQLHSRGMDTPARYGGDEFALIVPEASAYDAKIIAERIVMRVASDGEDPPISVSVGAAIYPGDGDTVELLLHAADRALYRHKHGKQGASRAGSTEASRAQAAGHAMGHAAGQVSAAARPAEPAPASALATSRGPEQTNLREASDGKAQTPAPRDEEAATPSAAPAEQLDPQIEPSSRHR